MALDIKLGITRKVKEANHYQVTPGKMQRNNNARPLAYHLPQLMFATSLPLCESPCDKQSHKCHSHFYMNAPKNGRGKGFGKKDERKMGSSAAQQRRSAAASRYDEMVAAGMPIYSIWIRLKDPPRPPGMEDDESLSEMPWLPVGSLSVPRSSQVAKAIFDAEEDLLQGANRLYPNMQKESLDNIEYGFQLKEFPDEDIRLAERPVTGGLQGALRNLVSKLTNPLNVGK